MTTLPRSARLERLRAAVAAGADTAACLNELLQILWGLPGQVQIDLVAGVAAEVIADSGGDPVAIDALQGTLGELRALAAIPGEEEVVHDDLWRSLSEVSSPPVLREAAAGLWPLFEAVDDRAFADGVSLDALRSLHALLSAVVERAMERHLSEADLLRWRARRSGARVMDRADGHDGEGLQSPAPLRPCDIPAVNAAIERFYLGIVARLEAARVAGRPEPESPSSYQWPLLGRAVGRCCGGVERHERGLDAGRSSAVERLLLRRAVRLECGERSGRDHLLLALRGESRQRSMRLGTALVRRAVPLFPQLHSNAMEQTLQHAEAQGSTDTAPLLPAEVLEELARASLPPAGEAGAVDFYWSVRALAEAARHAGDPDQLRKEIAHAVSDSIDARASIRQALEEPESWQRHVEEVRASRSPDQARALGAHVWLLRHPPSGVQKEELETGWALVIEMLEAGRP